MSETSSSGSDVEASVSIALDDVSLRFRLHRPAPQFKHTVINLLRRKAVTQASSRWLYRDLTLHLGHGERLGVIGPNGAGKSTLLKMIGGVYPPTTGMIRVQGRISPVTELGTGFNVELSGPDNVVLNGAFLGFGRAEMRAKTEGIMTFAGLTAHWDLPIKYYSTGMLLRLAFAIATDVEPEILLIDEVLGAGDGEFAARAAERLQQLLDASRIAVIVSHSLALIEQLCTRTIWLASGTIVLDGAPADVCRAYRSTFVESAARIPATT
jgi:ABC-type polysaccharide/polyol phosphate transport system, ATPase component